MKRLSLVLFSAVLLTSAAILMVWLEASKTRTRRQLLPAWW